MYIHQTHYEFVIFKEIMYLNLGDLRQIFYYNREEDELRIKDIHFHSIKQNIKSEK